MRIQLIAEIEWRENARGDQISAQAGHVVLLQIFEDAISINRPNGIPVDRGVPQMRNRCQYVISSATGGGQRWIGDAGSMQIQREILGQVTRTENLGNQLTIARAEADRVMLQLRVVARQAKIDDEQRHA